MLIRRFFAFVVSLFILFSLPLNAANAASDWTIKDTKSVGTRVIVTAEKGGYKSAVNIAPSAARLSFKLAKGANWAALLYAAIEAAPDLADIDSFKPQYADGKVEYQATVPQSPNGSPYYWDVGSYAAGFVKYYTAQSAAAAQCTFFNKGTVRKIEYFNSGTLLEIYCTGGKVYDLGAKIVPPPKKETRYLSIDSLAPVVVASAASGNAESQKAVRDTATEMVVAGDFDKDLLAGAVPINDSRPLIPAVPISGNGNVAIGDTDAGMTGGDVGKAADDARIAADDARKAAQAAADAAKAAADDARKAADDAADLVNSGADQAAIDAANERAAAAERAAADSKAVSDAAVAAANERAAAAERAAEAATQAAQAAATQAAADLADAIAAGDAAAVAAAEAAKAAADAAVADAKSKQAAAEKAAEKAKAEAQKPFELPPFCSWAAPVCDFIDWFKEPPPADLPAGDVPFATTGDVGLDDVDRFEKRIEFSGQCPVNDFSFTMMGVTYAKPIPYYHLCGFLEQIAPWLLAMCYLGVAYFVVENI